MEHPLRAGLRPWILSAAGLVLLCWLSFFNQLGTLGLTDKTESLFVEVARQMLVSGDWITPRWNGENFFDYPVWGYWMVALSFRLFGVSEWAARLPVALAASAVVFAGWALIVQCAPVAEPLRRRFGRGALAAVALALTPGWIGWGRSSVTDMFLSSAISLTLFGFLLGWSQADRPLLRRLGYGSMPVFSAIAVLAKGPVGLLLPGLVVGVFLLGIGQLRSQLSRMGLPWMTLVFLAVASPWYLLAARAHGAGFLSHFFGFSNLQRFTSVLYAHPGPWYFYLPWLLILLMPWSLALPVAIAATRFWQRSAWRWEPSEERRVSAFPLFLLVWLVVVVFFFSCAATKLPGYILPAVPAGSLLIALTWLPYGPPGTAPLRGLRISSGFTLALVALLAVGAVLAPGLVATDPAYPHFGGALVQSGLPLALALVLAISAVALMALLLWPRGGELLWAPNVLLFLGLLTVVVPPLTVLIDRERQMPLRELSRSAATLLRKDEPFWIVGYKRYSVVYYSQREAVFVSGADQARERFQDDPLSLGLQPGIPSVLLFGERDQLQKFRSGQEAGEVVDQRGNYQLLRLPISTLRRP